MRLHIAAVLSGHRHVEQGRGAVISFQLRNVLTVVPMEYKLKVRTYCLFSIGTGA